MQLERLSEKMDSVAAMQADPTEKLFRLVYTHLRVIRETVARNGSLRAEFFRNIWKVQKVRRAFDEEERNILLRVLTEGVEQGKFHIDNINLMTEIIHYAVRGLEVPYIYDRLGEGLTEEETYPMVYEILCRVLDVKERDLSILAQDN